ncbi:hypothetical protein L2E82_15185 [Cichorium intybus]|uniref:Uncharacterized protein n=1 Tax=Cichorium intybus TaxID=13427 RepID=A0ACB9F1F3_CICIN|nr:hypothetical protein L2E82_15185 [Cichorium intybus]
MAEDFQAAVYGGNWWTSPRTSFNRSSCSSVLTGIENFGPCWSRDLMDMKSKSSDESSDGLMVFHDIQKPSGITATMSPDSALQIMATAFSSPSSTTTTDWNQNLLLRVQEGLNTFPTSGDDDSRAVTEAEHQDFTMDQQQSFNFVTSSSDCTSFPVSSTSYAYPSTLLQSYLDSNSSPPPTPVPPPHQQPPYGFQPNSNDMNFLPKLHVPGNMHLNNNTPFWNASGPPLDDNTSSYFSSFSSQFLPSSYKEKDSARNLTIKPNHQEIRESASSVKKSSGEPQFKRPRLETPSPLPTFKVRKEKLGDRITALQQLVSPFGKTDTASVLHEAIEYIKLLHDQVNILSAPYIKNGAVKQLHQINDKVNDAEVHKQDLRSLGLCLVPVSSTFPVANGTATGFWTPGYEGSFR